MSVHRCIYKYNRFVVCMWWARGLSHLHVEMVCHGVCVCVEGAAKEEEWLRFALWEEYVGMRYRVCMHACSEWQGRGAS